MVFVPAFVSALAIFASKTMTCVQTNLPMSSINQEPARPAMMTCDESRVCPTGSMCVRFHGKTGLCVVEKYS